MQITEVLERAAKAREDGKSFLVVCFDTFDRNRGDDDLGYYYPAFNTAKEVREFLAGKQFGTWDPFIPIDFCEAVVDLHNGDAVHKPLEWLTQIDD